MFANDDNDDAFVTPERDGTKHRETCRKCNGHGRFIGMNGRDFGPCFACQGAGFKEFVQGWTQRAKARGQREDRKERTAQASREAFAQAHPEVWAWIESSRARFPFAQSMHEAIEKWGDLTEGQLGACQRSVAKRNEARAQRNAEQASKSAAVDASALHQAFDAAKAKGAKQPVMRFEGFKASLAAKHEGVIYLKRGETYLGKIEAGQFKPSAACDAEAREAILAAMADPLAQAIAYGRRTGTCSCCGAELTNALSIELGIGPICREKFGF